MYDDVMTLERSFCIYFEHAQAIRIVFVLSLAFMAANDNGRASQKMHRQMQHHTQVAH
jgi:hypothetical protein